MSNVVPFTPRPRPNADTTNGRGLPATGRVHATGGATAESAAPAPIGRAVYTVKETAEMLSLSLGGTYALIRSGEIPATKLGGRWVVPKRRFHDWLDNLPTASTEDIKQELAALERADARQARRSGA